MFFVSLIDSPDGASNVTEQTEPVRRMNSDVRELHDGIAQLAKYLNRASLDKNLGLQ